MAKPLTDLKQPNLQAAQLSNGPTQDIAQARKSEAVIRSLESLRQGAVKLASYVGQAYDEKTQAQNKNAANLAVTHYPSFVENYVKQKAAEENIDFSNLTTEQVTQFSSEADTQFLEKGDYSNKPFYQDMLNSMSQLRRNTETSVYALAQAENTAKAKEGVSDLTTNFVKLGRNNKEILFQMQDNLQDSTKATGSSLTAKAAQFESFKRGVLSDNVKSINFITSKDGEDYFKEIPEYHAIKEKALDNAKKINSGLAEASWKRWESNIYNELDAGTIKTPEDVNKIIDEGHARFKDTKGKNLFELRKTLSEGFATKANSTTLLNASLQGNSQEVYSILDMIPPKDKPKVLSQNLKDSTNISNFNSDTVEGLMAAQGPELLIFNREDAIGKKQAFDSAEKQINNLNNWLSIMPSDAREPSIDAWANSKIISVEKGIQKKEQFNFMNSKTDGKIVNYFKEESMVDLEMISQLENSGFPKEQQQKLFENYNNRKNEFKFDGQFYHPEVRKIVDDSGLVSEAIEGNFFTQWSSDTNANKEYNKNIITNMATLYYAASGNAEDSVRKAVDNFENTFIYIETPAGEEITFPPSWKTDVGEKGINIDNMLREDKQIQALIKADSPLRQNVAIDVIGEAIIEPSSVFTNDEKNKQSRIGIIKDAIIQPSTLLYSNDTLNKKNIERAFNERVSYRMDDNFSRNGRINIMYKKPGLFTDFEVVKQFTISDLKRHNSDRLKFAKEIWSSGPNGVIPLNGSRRK